MIEVGSDGDGLDSTSEPEKEDDGELGDDFDQTYLHVIDTLEQLEQQAETIGRRAVEIDGLPGASARPSTVSYTHLRAHET
eukprot:8969016-Lingulodinium_polyedra.AAC.1